MLSCCFLHVFVLVDLFFSYCVRSFVRVLFTPLFIDVCLFAFPSCCSCTIAITAGNSSQTSDKKVGLETIAQLRMSLGNQK